jgi:hypothetical protein
MAVADVVDDDVGLDRVSLSVLVSVWVTVTVGPVQGRL